MNERNEFTARIAKVLEPDETVRATARATDALIVVSDRRFLVADRTRLALSIPIEGVRRVQFDIEKRRPATLVIVPEDPNDEPQVLAIPADQLRAASDALTIVGERLAELHNS